MSSPHLLELPVECVVHVLREASLISILRFSEASKSAHDHAGDAELWRPLFDARSWTGGSLSAPPPPKPTEPGAWRSAYRRAARAESPVVLQLSDFRTLAGFARDTAPMPASCSSADVGPRVDAALSAIGLWQPDAGSSQTPLSGADVILVIGTLDSTDTIEKLLRHIFTRGARRARLADAALTAMRAAGATSGTVLFFDLDTVAAACVTDGRRLPCRRQQFLGPGVRRAIEFIAESSRKAIMPPRHAAGGAEVLPPSTEVLARATLEAMSGEDMSGRLSSSSLSPAAVAPPAVGAPPGVGPPSAAAATTAAGATATAAATDDDDDRAAHNAPPLILSEADKFIIQGLLAERDVSVQKRVVRRMRMCTLGESELAELAQSSREQSEAHAGGLPPSGRFLEALQARGLSEAQPASAPPHPASSAAAAIGTSACAATASSAAAPPPPPPPPPPPQLPVLDRISLDVGTDLSWLLQHHCYVRAVNPARRPVSSEEATMSSCVLRAPSGRKWSVAEERFMAYEQLFRPPPPPDVTRSAPAAALSSATAAGPAAAALLAAAAPAPTACTNPTCSANAGAASCSPRSRVAGSGWAAAIALTNPVKPIGSMSVARSGGLMAADSAIDALRLTIDNAANRQQLPELYGAIILAGPFGALPGLRQRFESELRYIRNDPDMPRSMPRTDSQTPAFTRHAYERPA